MDVSGRILRTPWLNFDRVTISPQRCLTLIFSSLTLYKTCQTLSAQAGQEVETVPVS